MIKVRGKRTGRIGYISEEKFNPALYEPVDTPTEAPQEQGIVSSLTAPFKRTLNRVSGAGESVVRTMLANEAERALAEGDTARAERLGELGSRPSRLTEDEEYRKKLEPGMQMAKDTAAILSWGLPTKGATSAFGRKIVANPNIWKAGATVGATGGFGYSQSEDLPGILTDTAGGAATGAVTAKLFDWLFPGKKAGERGTIGKTGRGMRKSAINPQVADTPQAYSKSEEIVDLADEFGLTGTPENMKKQINAHYDSLMSGKNKVLENSDELVPFNEFKKAVFDDMNMNGDYFLADKQQVIALSKQLDILKKKAVNGKISVKDIANWKNKIPAGGFDAIAKMRDLSPKQGLNVDLWHATDRTLTSLVPEVKQYTLAQSKLYELSKGVGKSSREAGRVGAPGLITVKAGGPVQSYIGLQNWLGSKLQNVGVDKSTKPLLESFAGGKIPAAVTGMSRQAGESGATDLNFTGTPGDYSSPEQEAPLISKKELQALAVHDAYATGGKNLTKIIALSDFLTGSDERSAADKKRVASLSNAEVIYQQVAQAALSAPSGAAGSFMSNIGRIPGVAGGPAEDLRRLTRGYAKAIAEAFAGAAGERATDADVERWLEIMPQPGDTREEKIKRLQEMREQMNSERRRLGI